MSIFFTKPAKITSSNERKAKVYFACHPDDFDLYFDLITDNILDHQQCLIYYTKDMDEAISESDKENILSQMNLFVVPITRNLLTKPCRAISVDIDYAIKNNKPILPFMMQAGLTSIYSKLSCFGERQYLTPYSNDITQIDYNDKLKKYLESILTDDETAQRVRNAFSAYIFLSYRHKDRSYANALMRLIHQDPHCRNIAIWYDEFLTIGEGFRGSIDAAMKKSIAFALVVTPQILEEPDGKPNFIMSEEYVKARELKKPIYPIEMEATDREQLGLKYDNIPLCIDPMDETDFQNNFLDVIAKFDAEKNGNTPEHDYLMGIAYLEGIDVEIDSASAISLLTSSANKQNPEAIKKLISVYRYGQGVEINKNNTVYWFEKYLSICEEKYQKSRLDEDGIEYIRELFEYAEYCREIGEVKRAVTACEKALKIADAIFKKQPSGKINVTALECQAIAYTALGNAYENNDLEQAIEYHHKASEMAKLIVEAAGTGDWLYTLAVTYLKLGECYNKFGSPQKAFKYYQDARNITVKMVNGNKTRKSLRLLAVCDNKYGSVFQSIDTEEALEKAKQYFSEAAEIARDLMNEYRDEEALRDYSVSLEKLGQLALNRKDYEVALSFFEHKCKLDEKLLEETGSYQDQRNISISYEKLGVIYTSKGDYSTALQWFSKCLQLRYDMLKGYDDNQQIKRDLFALHLLMFEAYHKDRSPDSALKHFQLAEKYILELVDSSNGFIYEVDLMRCYYYYGNLEKETNTLGAKQALLKGAEVAEKYFDHPCDNIDIISMARFIFILLSELSEGAEKAQYEKKLDCIREQYGPNESESCRETDGDKEQTMSDNNVSGLQIYYALSKKFCQKGDYPGACEALEEGIRTADRLLEVYSSDTDIIKFASMMCETLYLLYKTLTNCEKQKYCCAQKNLELKQRLFDLDGNDDNLFILAQSMAGLALEDRNNVNITLLDKALEIMGDICKRNPDNRECLQMHAIVSHIRESM